MSCFNIFKGKIRSWNKSDIILQHILSLFTSVNRVYKINKVSELCFSYFFDPNHKKNPVKDEIYENQKTVTDDEGPTLKEKLLCYYHKNDFLDLSLTFIDGHIIAYFGKEAFQKLKHSTRNNYCKALEIFNFSDKSGRIFYFKADHDVNCMASNIEQLLIEVERIIGLDKVKIVAFDRGGNSYELFKKLTTKFKINFITLVTKNSKITAQIKDIVSNNNFKTVAHKSEDEFITSTLNLKGTSYRALLIRNKGTKKIHPFITNMNDSELSDEDLLKSYSMHWNQEQEHNAFGKLGGNMHTKCLQEKNFVDNNKIKKGDSYKTFLNSKKGEIRDIDRHIDEIKLQISNLKSKIKPKSKQTDNKTKRKYISFYKKEIRHFKKQKKEVNKKIKSILSKIKRIPENPVLKKFKKGPVDYGISIVNLANNLNHKLIEIATKGKEKYQLSTEIGTFYNISAEVSETSETIFVEFFNVKQKKQVDMVKNLCQYFNKKDVKLREKTIKFSIKTAEK